MEKTDIMCRTAEPLTEDPGYEEIKNIVNCLKNHKGPGTDGITLSLIHI